MLSVDKVWIPKIINSLLFAFIFLTFFTKVKEEAVAMRIALSVIITLMIVYYLVKNRVPLTLPKGLMYYCIFLMFCTISLFSSHNFYASLDVIVKIVSIFIMCFFVSHYLYVTGKQIIIIKYHIVTACFGAAYYLAYIFLSGYYTYLLNTTTTDSVRYLMFNGNNPNYVGIIFSVAAFFIIISKEFSRVYFKYALVFLLLLGIFLTGSRKALISLALMFSIYMIIKSKNKMLSMITLLGILAIGTVLITTVPFLYNSLGWRLIGMFSVISDNVVYESSAFYRFSMLLNGLDLIKTKPFFGYGIDSYRHINTLGLDTYSHNNFIEIAVGIGILGMVFYYMFFVDVIKKCSTLDTESVLMAMPLLINLVLLGFVTVQYTSEYLYFFSSFGMSLAGNAYFSRPKPIVGPVVYKTNFLKGAV